jgi:hypothetical protein
VALDSTALTAISNASAATGVPISLLTAQALQESGGNQDAVGSSGEIGLMQLLPSTAAQLGVDPTDINDNAMGGALYDQQLYEQYGSWDLALAAYNSGEGTVNNAVANYGSNWTSGVPASTQNYVTNILGGSGLATTASAPGGISTLADDLYDTSADVTGGVTGFFESLSTTEIIGLSAAALLLAWYLI